MQDEGAVTLPRETVEAIQDVFDAAALAIQELYLRATREPHAMGVPPGVSGFWRLHARVVKGGDEADLDDIF